MRRINPIAAVGGVLLLLPMAASAQHAAPHVASAPRLAPMLRASSGNITITINNNSPSVPVTTVPATGFNFIPVPGLGFDIPHLAATRGAAAVGGVPGQFSGTPIGVPLFGTGVIIPTPVVVQMPPIVVQQPIILQQPASAAPAEEAAERSRAESRKAPAAEDAAKEEVRPVLEYVFVRRDGGMIFAVAYLWEKDHLEYITRDGLRRSVTLTALDLAATERFNEERGVRFRLPT